MVYLGVLLGDTVLAELGLLLADRNLKVVLGVSCVLHYFLFLLIGQLYSVEKTAYDVHNKILFFFYLEGTHGVSHALVGLFGLPKFFQLSGGQGATHAGLLVHVLFILWNLIIILYRTWTAVVGILHDLYQPLKIVKDVNQPIDRDSFVVMVVPPNHLHLVQDLMGLIIQWALTDKVLE